MGDPGPKPRLRRTSDDSQLLLEISHAVNASLDVRRVLATGLESLRRIARFGRASIQLIEDGTLRVAAVDPPPGEKFTPVSLEGTTARIVRTWEPLYVRDLAAGEPDAPDGLVALSADAKACFVAALVLHGRCIGIMQVDSPDRDPFSPETRARLLSCAPIISGALQNALTFQSEHDALAALQEEHRSKRDFVTVVSHELRTPLAVMLGFATAIVNNADRLEPVRIADLARRIIDSGRRLDRLVGDLLDASRIERGALRVDLGSVSLSELLTRANFVEDDRRPRIDLDIEEGLPPVRADEHRLHQVIDNVVGNARKFSPPDKDVTVSARRNGGDIVTLIVADRGPGIPEAEIDRVFEPFVQVGEHRGGGVGLGLYLVRELCSLMGAQVEIDSGTGAGTRVKISLPIARP